MIILEADCGTDKGIVITVVDERRQQIRNLRSRIFGRALADDVKEGRDPGRDSRRREASGRHACSAPRSCTPSRKPTSSRSGSAHR